MPTDFPNELPPAFPARPLFLGSEIYRGSSYGAKHPLAIPRVSTAIDLSRAMGWLPDAVYRDSPLATPEELARFHAPDYIAALHRAESDQRVDAATGERFNLGRLENPVFPEMYRRPAISTGAAILAGRLLAEVPAGIVYSPASGTHHARAGRASGFCYLNAPVLGILALLDSGIERVLYVDLDAHHGDGVEDAFADDDRVLTLSVHEDGRWPFTGKAEDRPGALAVNLPVPPEFNDTEMDYLLETVILPVGRAFRPQALVIQTGADALAEDPLSRLELSNGVLWRAVGALMGLAPRLMVVGGGGYNPWSVGRCWAGIWAVLNGIDPAVPPTPQAESVLRALSWSRAAGRNPPEHWFTTLADASRPGPLRDEVRRVAAAAITKMVRTG
ncbi:acetoin utilization protein AcuC [Azospirillum brasilense]|uniref:acetoin utilization protein AcuC n=1 Tax=Azospirillum brasilense TaxID=192 RepID=UPI000E69638B|nr:acetoin utilization protein AcuC [Azospirillum brasilense]NUB24609.1 acetoin utilization protein AcuC [Azospirillum brasilense]NUB31555.1 acetoin utilization protein AcuC [Azospirillum brasilense]RIW02735.1 acetoin utilization protein AcuC [Azospirillum brasilense]